MDKVSKRKKMGGFKYEISAGAVIFREEGGARKYLLLEYAFPSESRHPDRKSYWGFPKGLVERDKKESLEEAARREIREETCLADVSFVPGFKQKIHYFFRHQDTLVSKDAVYFLANAGQDGEVKISWEHAGFEWLPYEEALERLTHKNHREVLEAAEAFLPTKKDEAN